MPQNDAVRIFKERTADGATRIGIAWGQRAHTLPPQRTLLLGGARSGKSSLAERLLLADGRDTPGGVTYVATAGRREGDAEWAERIDLHRARRPDHWRTVETCELAPLLAEPAHAGSLLVDCLALWLTDAMDRVGAWDDATWYATGEKQLRERTAELVAALRESRRRVVAVSNEVGSGVVPATPSGRRFRDELGRLNAAFAAECADVRLVVAGRSLPLARG
ncbi:adenosyl cobinamide kinase/adenosyl cobinamide phosphate guanylyltransferase [Streptacidiphilus sp. BW17]